MKRLIQRIAYVALAVLVCVSPFSAATGTLMPQIFQTIFDANGNPVSGGCVWSYIAGTSTPLAVYTDQALTVPWTNPIQADTAGRFVAFLTSGVAYKFTFEAACAPPAHGTVIRTVDNVLAVPGTSNPTTDIATVDLRLSLTSGLAVTTADVTAATSIWVVPYQGNRIALYDGTTWNRRAVTATSIPVPATTSTMFDIFAYDNASTPTYETLAWTNDTTRATAIVTTTDGVWTKSGDATRRYLGSGRTTTVSGQTEDSAARRLLYNYAHRAPRDFFKTEATASWIYGTTTIRQVRASAANQVDFVIGVAEGVVEASYGVVNANDQATLQPHLFGLQIDATTSFHAAQMGGVNVNGPTGGMQVFGVARVSMRPAAGYHYVAMLEKGSGTGTSTWYGTGTYATSAVLTGWIWN